MQLSPAVGRWRMKSLPSAVYAVRAVAVLAFVLAPKTGPVVLVFAGFRALDIGLAIAAALAHLPIREAHLAPRSAVA